MPHTSKFDVFGPKPQCQTDRKFTRLLAVLVTNHFAGSWHRLSAAEPSKDPSAAASSGQLGISCKVLVGAKSAANSHHRKVAPPAERTAGGCLIDSLLVMTSLVRVHDSVSGLAIKQRFFYRSRVVGSELFAYSFSFAVIIGGGPPRAHVMDSHASYRWH